MAEKTADEMVDLLVAERVGARVGLLVVELAVVKVAS